MSRIRARESSSSDMVASAKSQLRSKVELCEESSEILQKQIFLIEQLLYTIKDPKEYSATTLKVSIDLLLSGRKSYRTLRKFPNLPMGGSRRVDMQGG